MKKMLLLLFVSAVVLSAQTSSPSLTPITQSQQGQSAKAKEDANANQEVTIKSPVVVKVEAPQKTEAELKEEADRRNESVSFNRESLSLNGSYVKATWILVVIGSLTVVVYAIQCRLLIFTLKHARESSEQALRAYVGLDTSLRDTKIDEPPNIFIIPIINGGQTPAYDLEAVHGWKWFVGKETPWPESQPYIVGEPSLRSRGTIMPNRPTDIRHEIVIANEGTFQTILDRADKGEITLYHYGTISYVDVFMKPHITNYCLRYRRYHPRLLTVCDHHNEST